MSLLTYEYHDLGCDAVDDGKICEDFFTGTPGKPVWRVRNDAHAAGWVTTQSPHTGLDRDYCPEHTARL